MERLGTSCTGSLDSIIQHFFTATDFYIFIQAADFLFIYSIFFKLGALHYIVLTELIGNCCFKIVV